MANIFTRGTKWLLAALNAQEQTFPDELDTDLVLPVVEIGQGGQNVAQYFRDEVSHPASTAGALTSIP